MSAPDPCTVLIGAADLLPALRRRTGDGGELLTFTDAEALHALAVITKRRPQVVALERLFAASPRGAALINRIKADPALEQSEIRVIAHDSDYSRISSRRHPADTPPAIVTGSAAVASVAAPPAHPLDQHGTRRAPRFKVAGTFGALLDGNPSTIIDLSTMGAQVVSSMPLKPNQMVRMGLSDEHDHVRFNAAVAWASFEIPPNSGPRYRAGIKFVDADEGIVGGFCRRHKKS